MSTAESGVQIKVFDRTRPQLYESLHTNKGVPLLAALMKESAPTGFTQGTSQQGANAGLKEHPFDMELVSRFQTANEHHSTCIHTKVSSTVGLGFLSEDERKKKLAEAQAQMDPANQPGAPAPVAGSQSLAKGLEQALSAWKISKVDLVLNPLCIHSWQDTLSAAVEDYWEQGNGYVEVVRESASGSAKITGLFHMPAPQTWVFVEENTGRDYHYRLLGSEGSGVERFFAEFGDLDDFLSRETSPAKSFDANKKKQVSEVIHLRRPSSKNRWYGFPDWISAVASIELIQCLRQYKYDFFNNRGVPEFMLFLLGQKLDPKDWKVIEDAVSANIGQGNSHKSIALNIQNENLKIELLKLVADGKSEEALDVVNDSYQAAIVTAHSVPPLLAGIQTPGKLGASNELPNAIRAFQLLRIGPAQRVLQMKLGSTLGEKGLNGGLGLQADDFTLRTLLDEINLNAMDTSSRMRQTEQAAASQGRDLNAGVKK